jgi:ribosomal protein L17
MADINRDKSTIKYLANVVGQNLVFGVKIHNHLHRQNSINHTVHKTSETCHAVRSMITISKTDKQINLLGYISRDRSQE